MSLSRWCSREMDLCNFITNIIEFCCSLFASILFYWPVISDLSSSSSLHMEQTWMLLLDFFTSMCWISYAIYQHPVSWFLIGSNISPPISQLLCFIKFLYYRFRGSQFPCPALRTIMALGTPPLIFIAVGLLCIFDVISGLCFAIFAISAGISSSILSVVQLWCDRTSSDWLILVLLRNILGVVSGVVGLLMGIQQHNIFFMINSAVVFVFALVQLGVALFAHKIHGVPWFSRGTSDSLPFESGGPSGS